MISLDVLAKSSILSQERTPMALRMSMITFQIQVLTLHECDNLVVKYGSLNENDLGSRAKSVVSEATPDEGGGGGFSSLVIDQGPMAKGGPFLMSKRMYYNERKNLVQIMLNDKFGSIIINN